MEVKEIDQLTNQIIKNFIKRLFDLECDDISLAEDVSIEFSEMSVPGLLLPPFSKDLEVYLRGKRVLSKWASYSKGMILLNKKFEGALRGEEEPEYDYEELITTLVHEKIHANVIVMTNKYFPDYVSRNGIMYDSRNSFISKYNMILSKKDEITYCDPIQNVYKKELRDNDIILSSDYRQAMEFSENLNEVLVELVALIASLMYFDYERNKNKSIMDIIKFINVRCNNGDAIKEITNIIINHNNLDLLKWTIYPLEYQQYDFMYDYFEHYRKASDDADIKILSKIKK